MKVGVVGAEASKFTELGELRARKVIRKLLREGDVVISGGCHLGGIDQWAVEEAEALGLETIEYKPKIKRWSGGYRERNLKIAHTSEYLICIVVNKLPKGYNGRVFDLCYHCKTKDHIKSGGCWTMWKAKELGKEILLVMVYNDGEKSWVSLD